MGDNDLTSWLLELTLFLQETQCVFVCVGVGTATRKRKSKKEEMNGNEKGNCSNNDELG